MVKLKGPSLSTEASGKLANALIFSTSKKRAYLKQHAKPANPRTGPQTSVRAAMKFLSQAWKLLTPPDQATWNELAKREEAAPYHAFIAYNHDRWHNFRAPSKTYPATETGPAPDRPLIGALGGVGMVTCLNRQGLPPDDWGAFYFRSTSSGAAFDHSDCVLWMPFQPVQVNRYIDTPLEPGTYWYVARNFSVDGLMSPPHGPRSAIVT